ncbi:MFS transporter [Candidatus Latescibacterota bacterium]
MREYLLTLRSFGRDTRLALLTAGLLGFAVYGGIYFLLLNLYLVRLGYDETFVGHVNAIGQLGFALSTIPAGLLGTRWGSRRIIILGLSLSVIGLGGLPLGEALDEPARRWWIMATYGLGFLGIGAYIVNINPFLADTTSEGQRSHAFSSQIALWPLAGFGGIPPRSGGLPAGGLPRRPGRVSVPAGRCRRHSGPGDRRHAGGWRRDPSRGPGPVPGQR